MISEEVRQQSLEVRRQRATLCREIKRGRVSLADYLLNPPDFLWEMPAHKVVQSFPGVGPTEMVSLNNQALRRFTNLFLPIAALPLKDRHWLCALYQERKNGK